MNSTTMSLDGQRLVVIGGTSGIGFAVADLAAKLGAEVVIASGSPANVEAAKARLGRAVGGTVDVRDEAGVARFFDTIGAFDHLVVTAGDWVSRCLRLAAASISPARAMHSRSASGARWLR